MNELPPALRAAIGRVLERRPRAGLSERAAQMSAAYRAGQGSAGVIAGADDALAYVLTRLPATYAACRAAFAAAAARAPGFRPWRLLDAGAGPGAASWAALAVWPDLAEVTWLDASPPFLALAEALAAGGPPPLADATTQRGDLAAAAQTPADLVVASYALAELAPARQAEAVDALWGACEGVLALVEPGTPAGHLRLLTARDQLIAAGATILAPCPHHAPCPLTAPDWCHFSVRLPRSREHLQVKRAEVPFEDEKFAYLVAARDGVAPTAPAPRVLAHPRAGKPGIELKLCTPDGVHTRRVARRDKAGHAGARRLRWGDVYDG